MRCIFTSWTIGMTSLSIGTKRTIGTNGDPSHHHQHQWSVFVSIGQPSLKKPVTQGHYPNTYTVKKLMLANSSGESWTPKISM